MATDIYARLSNYVGLAKATGFKVSISTIFGSVGMTAPRVTQLDALNALIRANSAGADAVCDEAAIPGLVSVTYLPDGIHENDAGNALVAAARIPVINSLMG